MNADIRKVHFMGICGTAMGAVAAMMKDDGYDVSGSDENVYPPMSTFLQEKDIVLQAGYSPENLALKPDLVVVGNAISRGNLELEEVLDERFYYLSLPETLKTFFLRKTHNLVVTGTHGKTTTTSLLAWIFEHAELKPSYLIGGIPLNFNQGCRRQAGHYWILEGDEYDTAFFDKRSKFLHYLPELVIINNIEFDHADIYASLDAIKNSFRQLVNIIPRDGMLLINADDANAREVAANAQSQILEVGFSENAAVRVTQHRMDASGSHFHFLGKDFFLPLFGKHNIANAAMAIAAAHFYQIPLEKVAEALKNFKGIKRRMEIRAEVKGITIVDDFGHHPTALRETMTALRAKFSGVKIWALFEPRSNTTRRNVFQKELPAALALADGVFVSQVARLEQLPENQRLNPEKVIADIKTAGKPAYYEPTADAIVQKLVPQLKKGDVVAVFSNGGFDNIHQKLIKALTG
ncbi:MAG: UDP-N-acetylmuramate:L-alanyl-gamma-D-glutamyl-meso-diaminopimelate ligase [Verrucomicrobiota bacterium]